MSFLVLLLIILPFYSYSTIPEEVTIDYNDTSISDDRFPNDYVSADNNISIPKTIITYSVNISRSIKYITDEEDYTTNESLVFSIYTNQQTSRIITILTGFAYENINYIINIENGRPTMIFSEDNQSELILTIRNDSEVINNGQWHRLRIERSDRQLQFILDNIVQSQIELSDEWEEKMNIFIGGELTFVPNGDYNGKLGDIIVTKSGHSLNLSEEETSDENLQDLTTTVLSSFVNYFAIAFLPNDNNETIYLLPIQSPMQTLSLSFRSHSCPSILVQFGDISLNIDTNGYLTLSIHDRIIERISSHPINDGNLYTIQLNVNNQTLEAWINENKKVHIDLLSVSLTVINFIFGLHNQFLGCIENVTYNNRIFTFSNLSINRQQCPSKDIFIKSINDKIISFQEFDRPFIVILDNPEEFQNFSFSFYTQESNGIICSLADEIYNTVLTVSIHHERLLLIYMNQQNERIEMLTNNSINDGNEHKVIIRLVNKDNLMLELDGKNVTTKIPGLFYIKTIYIGKIDGFIRERYLNFDGENFIGCMKDLTMNEKSLIQLDNIRLTSKITNTCQLTKRERQNIISYMSANISFSVRDYDDIIKVKLPVNQEFYHCQLSIKTRAANGTILSMYSNDDQHGLTVFLKDGQLHLVYHSIDDVISQLVFNDNQTINDGQQHSIIVSRLIAKLMSFHIQIDQRDIKISFPLSRSLFFDVVILGGTHREMPTELFVGCFANITYNHHLLLPEGIVKFDRYDCCFDQDAICDRQAPCNNNQSFQFCGQIDCSLVCTPSLIDSNKKGLLRYFSRLEPAQYEQIYLTIFTTAGNSTLFITQNGSIQVSIILQDYYPRLIIQNGGIIYTYDFPGRVRDDQWHILQCQKTLNTIDLTFDDETRHYTNLTEHFTLFTDNTIYLCGKNFNGYVQDIILLADNHHENLIQNSIHNPGLIDYDPSVTWNNRADIPERKFDRCVKLDIEEMKPFFFLLIFSINIFLYLLR